MRLHEVLYNQAKLLNFGDRAEAYPDSEIFDDKKFKSIAEYIRQHCSESIDALKSTNAHLYRWEKPSSKITISKTPENRTPKATSLAQMEYLNKALKMCGFTSLRNNSIFCTTSKLTPPGGLAWFTDKFQVFPFNGFKFTWSVYLPDIGTYMHNIKFGSNESLGDMTFNLGLSNSAISELTKRMSIIDANTLIKEMGLKHTEFNAALNSTHEISITGTYVMLPDEISDQIWKYLD